MKIIIIEKLFTKAFPSKNLSDYISNYKAHAMNRENKGDNIPTVISITNKQCYEKAKHFPRTKFAT